MRLPLLESIKRTVVSCLGIHPRYRLRRVFIARASPISGVDEAKTKCFVSAAVRGDNISGTKHGRNPRSVQFSLTDEVLRRNIKVPVVSRSLNRSKRSIAVGCLHVSIRRVDSYVLRIPPVGSSFCRRRGNAFFVWKWFWRRAISVRVAFLKSGRDNKFEHGVPSSNAA